IATVGLNPSPQEFLDRAGVELNGPKRRLETLASLGVPDRQSLTDVQCDRAIATMRDYFLPGKPVCSWFRAPERVVAGLGFSYARGDAVHLNIVQETTTPVWSPLLQQAPEAVQALLAADLPFLLWQIEAF